MDNQHEAIMYHQDTPENQNVPLPAPQDPYALMTEHTAAAFCDLTRRAMQNFRLKGSGPKFIKISARCVRYRRVDIIEWQEARLRTSTSDRGNYA